MNNLSFIFILLVSSIYIGIKQLHHSKKDCFLHCIKTNEKNSYLGLLHMEGIDKKGVGGENFHFLVFFVTLVKAFFSIVTPI